MIQLFLEKSVMESNAWLSGLNRFFATTCVSLKSTDIFQPLNIVVLVVPEKKKIIQQLAVMNDFTAIAFQIVCR